MSKLSNWTEEQKQRFLELRLEASNTKEAIAEFYVLEPDNTHVYSYLAICNWLATDDIQKRYKDLQDQETAKQKIKTSYALVERRVETYIRLCEKIVESLDSISPEHKSFVGLIRELRETFTKIKEELAPIDMGDSQVLSYFENVIEKAAKNEWSNLILKKHGIVTNKEN